MKKTVCGISNGMEEGRKGGRKGRIWMMQLSGFG
jgi:hypothetical protein